MDIELKRNLARIIKTLEGQGMKTTKIAQAIGYTATRQLYNTTEGKSMLSTKAARGLIKNLNVNPFYLFLGKGDMFIPDETEIETLRRENREWVQRHNEAVKTVMSLYDIIKKLEKRNADLIDLSTAAIKYHKGQTQDEQAKEDNEQEALLTNKWELENQSSKYPVKDLSISVNESARSVKYESVSSLKKGKK
jgi:hypothetical protein